MDKLQDLISRRNAVMNDCKKPENGGLSARERIARLFDEGSFIETDIFSGKSGDAAEGVITGYGTVDSSLVFAYAQDGAFGCGQAKKICKIMDMALKTGAPLVSLLDSCGTKLEDGIDVLGSMGDVFSRCAKASGSILQISAIFGTCAGGASFIPSMADFVIMTKDSQLMVNGPATCAKEGEILNAAEICSAEVNAKISGNAHFAVENEEEAIDKIKALISLLPSNAEEYAPEVECTDDLNRLSEQLGSIGMPVKEVIRQIADNCEFFEVSEAFAENVVTGFIRINGRCVSVIANDGELDAAASRKAADFIAFADNFNIPVLTLCDTDGYKASKAEETSGLSKYAAKLLYAYASATVPKVTVICSKSCTSAGIAMGSRAAGADFVLAWPNAVIGTLSSDMASVLLYEEELKNGLSRDAVKEKYENEYATALKAAETGYIDDVIEPDSTRPRIAAACEMLFSKSEEAPSKKHGSFRF